MSQNEGPIVSIEPIHTHRGDVDVDIDIEIGEHRWAPDSSTQGDGTPSISSLAPTLTSELVGIYSLPTRSSTIALTIDMITISKEFLQSLVDI